MKQFSSAYMEEDYPIEELSFIDIISKSQTDVKLRSGENSVLNHRIKEFKVVVLSLVY